MLLLFFFSNGHIHNVASTLPKVAIDVENDIVVLKLSSVVQTNDEIGNDDLTLFIIVNLNVDRHNVVSTLF